MIIPKLCGKSGENYCIKNGAFASASAFDRSQKPPSPSDSFAFSNKGDETTVHISFEINTMDYKIIPSLVTSFPALPDLI